MNPLEKAVGRFLGLPPGDEPICPPATFRVGEDAEVTFGTGPNPFHGMVVQYWPEGTDQ